MDDLDPAVQEWRHRTLVAYAWAVLGSSVLGAVLYVLLGGHR